MAVIDRAAIARLIPHAGRMCLLDTVDAWDAEGIRCSTRSHLDLQNPLRSGGRLAALQLCEYGAQATAVHGGLEAAAQGGKARPGLLAALREVEFSVDRIDDIAEALTVIAQRQLAGAGGCLYRFRVSAGNRWPARGRVSVIHP